ncbi:hypothetical protein ABIB80_005544 [Bradyrhizobium sp. i1.15.2]
MPTSNSILCADDYRYDHPLSLQSIMGQFERTTATEGQPDPIVAPKRLD